MGSWHIQIKGHGCHHNADPAIDADLATREFVDKLKAQGHTVSRAEFALEGQVEDLLQQLTPTAKPADETPKAE